MKYITFIIVILTGCTQVYHSPGYSVAEGDFQIGRHTISVSRDTVKWQDGNLPVEKFIILAKDPAKRAIYTRDTDCIGWIYRWEMGYDWVKMTQYIPSDDNPLGEYGLINNDHPTLDIYWVVDKRGIPWRK